MDRLREADNIMETGNREHNYFTSILPHHFRKNNFHTERVFSVQKYEISEETEESSSLL